MESGRKTNKERFVWVDVAVAVIGDASPTNLIGTDTSECAPSLRRCVEERRERGGKNAPCSFVQCERRKKWAVTHCQWVSED